GFTAADHLICTIVRQARNFPPAAGILHAKAEAVSATKPTAHCRAGYRRQECSYQNWHRNFWAKFPSSIKFPDGVRKLFNVPAQLYGKLLFLCMAGTAPPRQSSQCPGPIVPSLYSMRVSVSSLVWLGDK